MTSGTVNPSPAQQLIRDIERRKTLKAAIAKNEARGNTEKVAQLQEALEAISARVDAIRQALEAE